MLTRPTKPNNDPLLPRTTKPQNNPSLTRPAKTSTYLSPLTSLQSTLNSFCWWIVGHWPEGGGKNSLRVLLKAPQAYLMRDNLQSPVILPLKQLVCQKKSEDQNESQDQRPENPPGGTQSQILYRYQILEKLSQRSLTKFWMVHQYREITIPQVTIRGRLKHNTDQLPIYMNPHPWPVWS